MNMLELIFSTTFLATVIRMTTPILFAGLAGLIASQAGVMNLAVESIMLTSALTGVLLSAWTQSALAGFLGAVAAGMLLSFILSYTAFNLKADMVLSGVAFNLMMSGGTIFILYLVCGEKSMSTGLNSLVLPTVDIPFLKDVPLLGEVLSGHNILTYAALAMTVLMWFLLYRTKLGLRIRMVGENERAAESVGISARKIKYLAMSLSGLMASMGGVFMSMGYVSWFQRNMTAGRGFIGMAAAALGGNRPLGTLLSSALFGGADAVANTISSLNIPSELIQMIPYLATIVGLTMYSAKKKLGGRPGEGGKRK